MACYKRALLPQWSHKRKEDYGQANNLKGLYTDESPGLKVDPVVVLVLSVGFIISVVALHGKPPYSTETPCSVS